MRDDQAKTMTAALADAADGIVLPRLTLTDAGPHRPPARSVAETDIPPATAARWQELADILAEAAKAPAALVRLATPEHLLVLTASRSPANPYVPGSRTHRGGLFCEIALDLGRYVVVPDATADAALRRSSEREHGFAAYMGVPLARPDGSIFGTSACSTASRAASRITCAACCFNSATRSRPTSQPSRALSRTARRIRCGAKRTSWR